MKKIIALITSHILISVLSIAVWVYFSKPEIKIIRGKTKYTTIYKDVYKMPVAELQTELNCYYKSPYIINFNHVADNNYIIQSQLCDRKAEKEIKIEVSETSNFKLYMGLGIGAGVLGGGVLLYSVLK